MLGAGNVGWNAAWIAQGMEAEVLLLDKNLDRLRWVDQIHKGRIQTLASNRGAVTRAVHDADLVIGAVLVPGGRAPVLVTEEMIAGMREGAVIVDCAIDQGGSIEGIRETTHSDPVFVRHGVLALRGRQRPGRGAEHVDVRAHERDACRTRSNSRPRCRGGDAIRPALAAGVNTARGEVTKSRSPARSALRRRVSPTS